jgi:SAM-dependent methyltransferase
MPPISHCRSCDSKTLSVVLDLGRTPLANALLTETDLTKKEKVYPLTLVRCTTCQLLQITENVPGEELFSHYVYRSSFSDAFLRHCQTLAERMIEERHLTGKNLVIDIASNDGYLLQFYQKRAVPILGIEPAKNIASIAVTKGIPTRTIFFTDAAAKALVKEGVQADVIHAHNVMPHVSDQRDFARGIATLLKPHGIAVVEFAYAIDTIDHTEFDQIYHEHMCYFSLTAYKYLVEQFGLAVVRAERIAVHGGSLRVFLAHAEGAKPDATVATLLREEEEWGVATAEPYVRFAKRTTTVKRDLLKLLKDLKASGKRIVVYGASAKGATLMNYCGIGSDLIDYIVDRSTLKQGSYSPGTHLKIEPVEKLLSDAPDYALLCTWNFAEEILAQQKEYRAKGGKFIIPVPEVRVV